MFNSLIPYEAAYIILAGNFEYYRRYKCITKRGQTRFESQDWLGTQEDVRERISIYQDIVQHTTDELLAHLGDLRYNRAIWKKMKLHYAEEIANHNTRNIAETFYNSIYRHSHRGMSVDKELMFIKATSDYKRFHSIEPIYHTYRIRNIHQIDFTFRQIMYDFPFEVPFENKERDISYASKTLTQKIEKEAADDTAFMKIDVLQSVFYRNKGAYIVGRFYIDDNVHPFIIPILHEENGIYIDTLLLERKDVSSIFSYYRYYFLVDTDIPRELVDFLKTIVPSKSLTELYNCIGFVKHGKTILYRDFKNYIQRSEEKFIIAPGIKGMVMSVFTAPDYNMVFKIIKDKFAPPKNMTQADVREKYHLVSVHDRVGRMADTHTFENFKFPLDRFSDELIEELKTHAASKIKIYDNILEIKHLYIEKKMIPLNMYLEYATPEQAREAINEYGKAIKQLAAVNIFPGDMLLKNFGVTPLKRVVFYDYDEIGFLTDYNFRIMPEPRDEWEEMSSGAWFSVGANDIFPEEFPRFLIGNSAIRTMFYELHGDLFGVKFWREMQKRLNEGEIPDVFPYPRKLRFRNVFLGEKG